MLVHLHFTYKHSSNLSDEQLQHRAGAQEGDRALLQVQTVQRAGEGGV